MSMSKGVAVLIVDDEPPIRRFLRSSLAAAGYRVIESEDAAGALRLLAAEKPDVIILDLGLPDRSGVDLIPEIRNASTVPIVVLSARHDEHSKVEALDLALQLHFLFKMRGACGGLMGSSPERPGDDVSGLDVLLVRPHGHSADLLHRPADQDHGPIGAGLAPAWVGRMARSLAARQSLSRHSGDGGLPPAWQRPA